MIKRHDKLKIELPTKPDENSVLILRKSAPYASQQKKIRNQCEIELGWIQVTIAMSISRQLFYRMKFPLGSPSGS